MKSELRWKLLTGWLLAVGLALLPLLATAGARLTRVPALVCRRRTPLVLQ
jgi:hypothetical protein